MKTLIFRYTSNGDIIVGSPINTLKANEETIIYPHELILEPVFFISRVTQDRVTILEVVPSYLSVILDNLEPRGSLALSLYYLLVTGEEVKPQLVKKWFEKSPHIPMVNAYGPTEASDDITHYVMNRVPDGERVPIGKPLPNFNIYILDKNMQLCPPGVKGEICVSGLGVGRGYLNHPELSNRFFCLNKSQKIYKTGDIGCWLQDGTIDFFGRKDFQVKIRGFRIELGEIENKILGHAGVKDAVVTERTDTRGNKYLCAYVVPAGGGETTLDDTGLKEWLARELPFYMIPEHIMQLNRIPLTANGKTDRGALPEPRAIGQEAPGKSHR